MFFILSKILFYILNPIIWIIGIILFALFTRKEKNRKKALIATTVLLFFFTNPFICNQVWLLWEYAPQPISKLKQYDAAIILTGITNQDKTPHDRIYTNKGADRILLPLRLYKEGYVKKIIISGGSGALLQKYSTEAGELKQLLLYAGVPANDILVEDQSRNTHENALQTKAILVQHPELKSLLLVTSAFHMRRAFACFLKEGMQTDAFSTDFYTKDISFTPDRFFIPQEVYLYHWQILIHEMFGYITYHIAGYC